MPILYSVISRGTTILAKYADCVGNFAEVTEQIIAKIGLDNHKLTYTHGEYQIHYICENRIIYMCITDSDFERVRAFFFLTEIKQKFIHTYGLQVATAIAYAMNTEFSRVLAELMDQYGQSREDELIAQARGDLNLVQDIMVKRIDDLRGRGERLELLVNKTESLSNNSVAFRKTSRNLARQMFWKRIRVYVAVTLIILFIVYVIISMACGGLAWQGCIAK